LITVKTEVIQFKHTELTRIKKSSKLVNSYSESDLVKQNLFSKEKLLEKETNIKLRFNSE